MPGFSETAFCADTGLTAESAEPGCAEAWTSPAGAENTPSDTGKNRDESSCNGPDGKTPLELPPDAPTPFNKKPDGATVVGADRTADTAAAAANSLKLSTPNERWNTVKLSSAAQNFRMSTFYRDIESFPLSRKAQSMVVIRPRRF